MSQLVRMAYDKETLVGWRAIKAVGLAAKELVKTDYDFLRETIRKLLWSLTDESGGIGWSAPEIIGEIVCADTVRFRDIIPIIVEAYDIEEKTFRPGILHALGRVAEADADLALPFKDLAVRALADEDPMVRYFAIELISRLKIKLDKDTRKEISKSLQGCVSDRSEVWVYEGDSFSGKVIGETAEGCINKMKSTI